jgi:serine/threonine protein kinase
MAASVASSPGFLPHWKPSKGVKTSPAGSETPWEGIGLGMQDALKKFGRYFLLDMIAQGGMAEIFRARQITTEGLGRTLVIKRIQPTYGSNSEFVSMFQSETRVMMNFNHPNVVQLQDFGEEDKQPFIAMEYIEGKSLRYVKDRILERVGNFPPDLAVYIIAQAAAGLHYAHTFKDKLDGKPLNLVHRDISPQNILLSYDGNVKIIDFGIAKASTNSEQTRAGVIKGKPSYLSPEQIDPGTGALDGRSDLFSLGIVLWELLTGRKLFAGDNDLATLRLIQNCQNSIRPPSEFNKLVPKELDYIVLQSLAKDREKRFPNALEFQRKLQRWLVSFNPDFNPLDLAGEIKHLFANEIVEDRKNLQRLNEKAGNLLSLLTEEERSDLLGLPPSVAKDGESKDRRSSGSRNFETTQVDLRQAHVDIAVDPPKPVATAAPQQAARAQQPRTGATPVRTGTGTGSGIRPRAPKAIPQGPEPGGGFRSFLVACSVAAAVWTLYGEELGLPGAGSSKNPQQDMTMDKLVGKVARAPAKVNQIALQLQINPAGGVATVRVNGKPIPGSSGQMQVPVSGELTAFVAMDEQFQVEVDAPGFKPKTIEGMVDPSRLTMGAEGQEFLVRVDLEPESFGILKYRSATASANLRVEVGGQQWVYRASVPGGVEIVKLPPGRYRLEFYNVLDMGQVIENFVVEKGQTRELEVSLVPLKR